MLMGGELMSKVEYWIDVAKYDLDTAKAMRESKRYLYVGFMCHQVIEKALKAYFVKHMNSNPPYTHNLTLLAEKSGIYSEMTDEQKDFLDFLEPLNIEARYPTTKEKLLSILNEERCLELVDKTEGEFEWIMKKL